MVLVNEEALDEALCTISGIGRCRGSEYAQSYGGSFVESLRRVAKATLPFKSEEYEERLIELLLSRAFSALIAYDKIIDSPSWPALLSFSELCLILAGKPARKKRDKQFEDAEFQLTLPEGIRETNEKGNSALCASLDQILRKITCRLHAPQLLTVTSEDEWQADNSMVTVLDHTILVWDGLLSHFSRELKDGSLADGAIRAVLAHEVTHILHADGWTTRYIIGG